MGVGTTNKRVEGMDEANGRIFEGFRMRRYALVGMIYYATELMGAFLKAFYATLRFGWHDILCNRADGRVFEGFLMRS
jgi:hypothetical protein